MAAPSSSLQAGGSSDSSKKIDICYLESSTPDKLTAPLLMRSKEHLQGVLNNQNIALEQERLQLIDEEDVEKIIERIQSLQKELHTGVVDLAQQELLLKRLQLSHTLMEELFPPNGVPEQETHPIREHLKTLVLKQCQLVSQVLSEQKATEELRPKLEEIQGKNFALIQDNRRLMSKLKERQESQSNKARKFSENAEVEMVREKVEKLIWRTELQRNTLQGLVLGSGVNWAQDEQLTEMLLGLGRPLNG